MNNDNKPADKTQDRLTTKQAAKFLGVTVRTIMNYCKAGILTPEKSKSGLTFSENLLIEGVKRLLERCETFLKKQPKAMKRYQKLVKSFEQGMKSSTALVPVSADNSRPDANGQGVTSSQQGVKRSEPNLKKSINEKPPKRTGGSSSPCLINSSVLKFT